MPTQADLDVLVAERARLAEEHLAAQAAHAEAGARMAAEFAKERAVLDRRIRETRGRLVDLPVLIRKGPGPRPSRFHSATDPCGRVTGKGRSLANFSRTTASVARGRGLTPCTACSWHSARWAAGELAKGA